MMRINENLIVRSTEKKNTWINLNGEVGYALNHASTDFLPIAPGNTYTLSKIDSAYPMNDGTKGYFRFDWHDENKTYLGRLAMRANVYQWPAPANAHFIRVSYPMDAMPKLEFGTEPTLWTPAHADLTPEQIATLPPYGEYKEIQAF